MDLSEVIEDHILALYNMQWLYFFRHYVHQVYNILARGCHLSQYGLMIFACPYSKKSKCLQTQMPQHNP